MPDFRSTGKPELTRTAMTAYAAIAIGAKFVFSLAFIFKTATFNVDLATTARLSWFYTPVESFTSPYCYQGGNFFILYIPILLGSYIYLIHFFKFVNKNFAATIKVFC